MKYQCAECDMSVTGLACGKCGAALEHANVTVDDKAVAVSKCPKGCGMIKSPQCCGQDMDVSDQ